MCSTVQCSLYNDDYTAEHILTTTPNQSVECKWEIVKQKEWQMQSLKYVSVMQWWQLWTESNSTAIPFSLNCYLTSIWWLFARDSSASWPHNDCDPTLIQFDTTFGSANSKTYDIIWWHMTSSYDFVTSLLHVWFFYNNGRTKLPWATVEIAVIVGCAVGLQFSNHSFTTAKWPANSGRIIFSFNLYSTVMFNI